jgi:uncharacterized protein involved in outer membrane biogenesis
VALLLLLVATATALLVLQPVLHLTQFKGRFEEVLTTVLGSPVMLERVHVQTGLWLEILLEGLTVAPADEALATDFASADAVTLRLALIPLLRHKIRLDRFTADGLELHVHRDESGAGNWPAWTPSRYRIESVQGIELTDVLVLFEDEKGRRWRRALEIERLEAGASVDAPFRLELEGWLEEASASLWIEGGRLGALQRPEEWPLQARLELGSLQVELDGAVALIGQALDLNLVLTATADSSAAWADLAGIDVPEVGPLDLRAQLAGSRQTYSLSPLSGTFGTTSFDGSLKLELSETRPLLQGHLNLGHLDLRGQDLTRWLDGTTESTAGKPLLTSMSEQFRTSLDLSLLEVLDADVELKIDSVSGAVREAQELRSDLSLRSGLLEASLQLVLDSSPIEGVLVLGSAETPPHWSVDLTARELDLRTLAPQLADDGKLAGRLGSLRLAARSRGTTTEELLSVLSLTASVEDSQLTYHSDTKQARMEIELRRISVEQREGRSLTLDADGLLQQESVSLSLSSGSLAPLLTARAWPIGLTARYGEAVLELAGEVRLGDDESTVDLRFAAEGPRIRSGGLLTPPQVKQSLDLPWKFRGRYVSEAGKKQLRIEEARIGRTTLHGDFQQDSLADGARLRADLVAETLDPGEILALVNPVTRIEARRWELQLDAPILPSEVDFGDSDIELKIGRVFRTPEDVTDLSTSLRFRSGRMLRSPFSFRVADAYFRGTLGLHLEGETPEVSFDLEADRVDVKELLAEDPAPGLSLTTDHLQLDLVLRGRTLEEMLRRSRVFGTAQGIRGEFETAELGKSFPFELERAQIEALTGGTLTVEANGLLNEAPLSLTLRFDQPQQVKSGEPLYPFQATVDLGGTEAQLGGMTSLPLEARDLALDFSLRGASLADLSQVSGRDLPPLGPFRLSGQLTREDDATKISGLDLTLGESDLRGEASLSMASEPPRFVVQLVSNRLRLVDFIAPQAEESITDSQTAPSDSPAMADTQSPDGGWAELITRENLMRLDAVVSIGTRELVGTEEVFGSGEVAARLQDGRLVLTVSGAEIYEGSAQAHLEIGASEQGLEAAIRSRVERLSYGPLLQLFDPDSTSAGEASLDLDIEAAAPSLAELVGHANGHLSLTDYPEGISSSFLDLWGGHLSTAFFSLLTPNRDSKVNCSVSEFSIADGRMTAEVLILDTTRMRARGKGKIDLGEGTLDLTLRPRPKTRGVISLATPAKLGGTFEDPKLSFSKTGTALTAVRIYYWFWVMWHELLRKPLPADGSDICLDPPRRAFSDWQTVN